jgi:hypothetical protein
MEFEKKNIKNRGQVMVLTALFFLWISVTVILGIATPAVRHITMATAISLSKESYYVAEAGMEDAVFRLVSGLLVPSSQTFYINGNPITVAVTDEGSDGKQVVAQGEKADFSRKIRTHVVQGSGSSFHYGIQAGQGGFILKNSATVEGNVHSGGSIIGEGNTISGDVVSSGSSGLLDHIRVTGNAYANRIEDSIIEKNAYFKTISGTTVYGSQYPNSPDQPHVPFPISDEQIAEWESDAEAGGVIDGTSCSGGKYSVNTSMTLGPVKINCNLEIKGNSVVLTVAGPVWVVGNIDTQTGPTIRVDPALGNKSVVMIADNPSDRLNGSRIILEQNTEFENSDNPNSFIFMISHNNSSENGGDINAIDVGQSAGAIVAYAPHGQITLGQSVGVKEATAYKIILTNTANVKYETGLPNALFSSGPSGGYEILSWLEIE